MGAQLRAFLQFDDNSRAEMPPFSNTPSTWDLAGDIGLSAGKDYRFFAAIAGIRNDTGVEPLYSPRGLPPHDPSDPIADLYDYLAVGWLTLTELRSALEHMMVDLERLSDSVLLVLDAMEAAERRLGPDRVRLVFGFID